MGDRTPARGRRRRRSASAGETTTVPHRNIPWHRRDDERPAPSPRRGGLGWSATSRTARRRSRARPRARRRPTVKLQASLRDQANTSGTDSPVMAVTSSTPVSTARPASPPCVIAGAAGPSVPRAPTHLREPRRAREAAASTATRRLAPSAACRSRSPTGRLPRRPSVAGDRTRRRTGTVPGPRIRAEHFGGILSTSRAVQLILPFR